jgi:hypothetical protein
MVWSAATHDLPNTGSWVGSNAGATPAISQVSLLHTTEAHSRTPVLIWQNPTGKTIPLRITGSLTLQWQGPQIQPGIVEIAIARGSAAGTWVALYLKSVEKPTNNASPEIKQIPLNLFTTADSTDSIRVSIRIAENAGNMRLLLADALNFTIVPDDLDGDGLSNAMEQQGFGTNPVETDTDGDGWSDKAEVEFQGNPSNSATRPLIQSKIMVDSANQEALIQFPAEKVKVHAIQTCETMPEWTTLEDGIAGDGGVISRIVPTTGKPREFFRIKHTRLFRDPAVAAYQNSTGISDESAAKIDAMLTDLRAAGMDPSFLWVGGSAYNQPNQARAVIGGLGEVVGAETFIPFGEKDNACRFSRGKFLQFDQPANLRAEVVENLAIAIWFEETDHAEISRLLSTFESAARGFRLFQTETGETRFSSFVSATGNNNPDFYPIPTWSRKIPNRSQYYRLEKTSLNTTQIHNIQEADAGIRNTGLIYNNHSKIRIGGESLTATNPNEGWSLANCRINAVAIAPSGPKTASVPTIAADQTLKVTNAPYRAGIIPRHSFPLVLTLGDSITATKWNAFAFSSSPTAGAWFNQAVIEDYAVGGTSMDYHMSLTPYIKQALADLRFQPRYLVYTPEEIEPSAAVALGLSPTDGQAWYDLMAAWLKEISRETGCQIALCSYIKGNNADSSVGEANRVVTKAMAHANGWGYVPLREEPHSQVWTGGVPGTYGFYQDSIHQTGAGAQIQAEVFSAAIPHPYDTDSPRADLNYPPVISGTNAVGKALSCFTGKWFNAPATFTYQWLRNLSAITGATSDSYIPQTSDIGTRLACRVTAASPEHRQASFTSAPTGAVTP